MKKRFPFFAFLSLIVFGVTTLASCKKHDDGNDKEPQVIVANGQLGLSDGIRIAGFGTATIDWGDGSELQTITLAVMPAQRSEMWGPEYSVYHAYPDLRESYKATITGNVTSLVCSNSRLTSLSINMPVLTLLDCTWNGLTELDMSKCTALKQLECADNYLTSLNVSQCPALTVLSCSDNFISTLNISNCTALTYLYCHNNHSINALDVSKCSEIKRLGCSNNKITSLNLARCTGLEFLNCESNDLSSLNLNKCPALKMLYCGNNSLTALDVSNCVVLQSLHCERNSLTALDLGRCTSLLWLYCSSNNLTSLTLGTNTALEYVVCYNNLLNRASLITLLTSLPSRNAQSFGTVICYIGSPGSAGLGDDEIAIATTKNWVVDA